MQGHTYVSISRRGSQFQGKGQNRPSLPPPGTGYAHWGSPLEALEDVAMTLPALAEVGNSVSDKCLT